MQSRHLQTSTGYPKSTYDTEGAINARYLREPSKVELLEARRLTAEAALSSALEQQPLPQGADSMPSKSVHSMGTAATYNTPQSQPEQQKSWDTEAIESSQTASNNVIAIRNNYLDRHVNPPHELR